MIIFQEKSKNYAVLVSFSDFKRHLIRLFQKKVLHSSKNNLNTANQMHYNINMNNNNSKYLSI